MAIQGFYRQRRPRQFEHKPIYWDPRKEELERRVRRIRNELIASGEIEGTPEQERESEFSHIEGYNPERRIRGTFVKGTEHLQKQRQRGISSADRDQKTIRLVLVLLAMGFLIWFFGLR